MADKGPLLLFKYVTILQLKQQSSIPKPNIRNSNTTIKIPKESIHPRRNQPPIMKKLKPDVTPHDSASNCVHYSRNHQLKPDAKVADYRQKIEKQKHRLTIKNNSRNYSPNQIQTEPEKKKLRQIDYVPVKEINMSSVSHKRWCFETAKTPFVVKKKAIVSRSERGLCIKLASAFGRSYSSEATLLPKDNLILPKVVQDYCFGRSTLRRFQKFRASEYQMLLKTLLSNFLRKTKTSEEIPSSKTVAEHFQSTKGTDTRHAGLMTDRDNM
ncbi:hypothetical protein E3N88_22760 [Mikania micrantha]|uniref:Uncharacterized protein n=1 Tax=Mikania micrantha TaxID=192012 RepID=A0A5N6NCE9_9ASTR|nr:hypothetical protein E3N88_22760 [Mikania micrantha]